MEKVEGEAWVEEAKRECLAIYSTQLRILPTCFTQ